jgi:hypothetical protein
MFPHTQRAVVKYEDTHREIYFTFVACVETYSIERVYLYICVHILYICRDILYVSTYFTTTRMYTLYMCPLTLLLRAAAHEPSRLRPRLQSSSTRQAQGDLSIYVSSYFTATVCVLMCVPSYSSSAFQARGKQKVLSLYVMFAYIHAYMHVCVCERER